jgi:hypothetical protein
MAHFIKLNVYSEINRSYNATLVNLDMVVMIEPCSHNISFNSLLYTKAKQNHHVYVKENLDEILKLSTCCK